MLPRPGVLRLMDEARAAGLKVAVASAATKSAVAFVVENLLTLERFQVRLHGFSWCVCVGGGTVRPHASLHTSGKHDGVDALLQRHCIARVIVFST